jgi:Ca2+-binding EF-hand superfamily protein
LFIFIYFKKAKRQIDFEEFTHILLPLLMSEYDDIELLYVYRKFDWDNSGTITVRELAQVLAKLGQIYSDRQRADIISSCKTDKEGRLNFTEFARLMKNLPQS